MAESKVRVINLSQAPGAGVTWGRPRWMVYLWALVERVVVTNSFQVSSRLRAAALRRFGASIGEGVILRPGLRVKYPWKLRLGDRCWVGEDVWIHNQDQVTVGADVVISQDTFITTGTHAFREDMALTTRPITIDAGVWVTSRCMVLGGSHLGTSALILPNTVVKGAVPANTIFGTPQGTVVSQRFADTPASSESTQAR